MGAEVIDFTSAAIGLAAGLVLAAIFIWARRPRGASLEHPPPPAGKSPLPPGSNVQQEIDNLLARGQKIEAIKLLREATGCGLKEAKEQVEAMEQGR